MILNQKRLAAGIQMYRDETEENFVPNADPESLAKAQIAKHETKQLDATGWLAADLHFADIPWLK